jgi:hypothetical protein
MILVSLHTKSSSMFHAKFVYKLFLPKCRILTMKTLSYKLRRLSICSFDQITSLLFSPFQSCFIYHVLTMCFYFVDDVVTSWPQTKISDWSEIKCMWCLLYRIEHVLSQKVYHATSKRTLSVFSNVYLLIKIFYWYDIKQNST